MTLGECLKKYEGKKVRVGAYSAFLYFGISDKQMAKDMKKIDPGCLEKAVLNIYKSQLTGDIVIIYDSIAHGRFWFESEFLRAKEKGELFIKRESHTSSKKPKLLTYSQKKKLSEAGYDPSEYRFFMKDGKDLGFMKILSIDFDGKIIYDSDNILWIDG